MSADMFPLLCSEPSLFTPPDVIGSLPREEETTLDQVAAELARARAKHGPMHSAHEAYAVILEELDEFKAEVWAQTGDRNQTRMRRELIQLAAMAIRAIEDLQL